MTDFWTWLPADGWERLAADALWQSTALAAAALIAAWSARRRLASRPALRAAILLAAAVLSVAVPLLSTVVRATGVGVIAGPLEATQPLLLDGPLPVAVGPPAEPMTRPLSTVAAALPRQAEQTIRPVRVWPLLAGAWLACSGWLALRLARGWMALLAGIRCSEPCRDPEILAALSQAAATLSVRPPDVWYSPWVDTPALTALGRPRLLLPRTMPAATFAQFDWYAVFCHELAHLARRDGTSRLAVELCCVLLPWQPLLWLVLRRFRAACEEACDDWAVVSGADPVEFASLLLAWVPASRPALALGMADSPATTRRRIVRLLAMQKVVRPRLGRIACALGWGLAVVMAAVIAVMQFRGPTYLNGKGTLEPAVKADVFAGLDGAIDEVLVEHGQFVKKGEVLAKLRSPDLEASIIKLRAELTGTQEKIRALQSALNEPASGSEETGRIKAELAELQKREADFNRQLAALEKERQKLLVTSPIDGQIHTWQVQELLPPGRPVKRGQVLMTVADSDGSWELEIRIPADRVGPAARARLESRPALPVRFIVQTNPSDEHVGVVEEVHAHAEVRPEEGKTVRVRVALDKSQLRPTDMRPGATVMAKINCGRVPSGD